MANLYEAQHPELTVFSDRDLRREVQRLLARAAFYEHRNMTDLANRDYAVAESYRAELDRREAASFHWQSLILTLIAVVVLAIVVWNGVP